MKLKDINPIPPEDYKRIVYDFNDTAADYPKDKLVHQLIEDRAEQQPNATAVVASDHTLSFRQLNEEANQIANSLLEKGIGHGDIVAVILPRTSHLIPALLGVLKTGAAYMPVDPSYPQERIDYLLSESKARFSIDEASLPGMLQTENRNNPNVPVGLKDYFCALHTSGSTGRPKLTVLMQYNLLNFLYGNLAFWENVETVISVTIVTFDIFMQDTLLSLSLGKKLILASNDQIFNQAEFEKMFESEQNVMFFSTPTKLTAYIKQSETNDWLQKITTLIVGGEVFTDELYDLLNEKIRPKTVRNGYGPAETSIGVSYKEIAPPRDTSGVGHPITSTGQQKPQSAYQYLPQVNNGCNTEEISNSVSCTDIAPPRDTVLDGSTICMDRQKLLSGYPDIPRVYNGYGPAETTLGIIFNNAYPPKKLIL